MNKDNFEPEKQPEVRYTDVVVDTEEMAAFLFDNLVTRGFVPTENELEEIADIMFEYFLYIGIIDEADIEEE